MIPRPVPRRGGGVFFFFWIKYLRRFGSVVPLTDALHRQELNGSGKRQGMYTVTRALREVFFTEFGCFCFP